MEESWEANAKHEGLLATGQHEEPPSIASMIQHASLLRSPEAHDRMSHE